jgi:hypothetical protein
LENIEEMDKFLDIYDHLKLNQEVISHLNRSIPHNEIEATVESPKKDKSRPDRFSAAFYQIFKKELIPTFLKFFYEIEREVTLTNSFYEASIILIPKL